MSGLILYNHARSIVKFLDFIGLCFFSLFQVKMHRGRRIVVEHRFCIFLFYLQISFIQNMKFHHPLWPQKPKMLHGFTVMLLMAKCCVNIASTQWEEGVFID